MYVWNFRLLLNQSKLLTQLTHVRIVLLFCNREKTSSYNYKLVLYGNIYMMSISCNLFSGKY